MNAEVLSVAKSFQWSVGEVRVHVHSEHVGIYGQWIYTWRPWPNTQEIAVFLEDDVDMSIYAYRWLKAVVGVIVYFTKVSNAHEFIIVM